MPSKNKDISTVSSETLYKEMADAMVYGGFREAGYQYVCIDVRNATDSSACLMVSHYTFFFFFFFYKNLFYKNVEAEINQNFKNIPRLRAGAHAESQLRTSSLAHLFLSRCEPLCSMRFVKRKFNKSWLAQHFFSTSEEATRVCDTQLDYHITANTMNVLL